MRYRLGIIITILILSLQISSVPANLTLDQEPSDITGYSVPRIDGFIDQTAPSTAINEWEDGLSENIVFNSLNSELEIEMNTKYIADTLFLSVQSSTDLKDFVVQLDTDNDGSLSPGDARLEVTMQSNYGKRTSTIQTYSSNQWMSLAEYNSDYANYQGTPVIGKMLANIGSISIGDTGKQIMVEMSFSLSSYQDIFGVDVAQIDTSDIQEVGFGISIRDMSSNIYGYPSVPESTLELDNYKTYHFKPIDFSKITTDLSVDRIEVTQSVQTSDNALPLVKNKETLARVFVNRPSDYTGNVEVKLSATFININPLFSGTWETLSKTFSPPISPQRSSLSSSANFELPDKWTQADWLILKAEVSPVGYIDTSYDDNIVVETVNFRQTHDLNIYYLEVNEATATSPSLISDIRPDFISDAIDNFEAMYPSANPNFIELGWEELGVFSGTQRQLKSKLNKMAMNIALDRIFQDLTGTPEEDLPPMPDFIFGFRTSGAGHSTPKWLGWSNSFAAWGGLNAAVDTLIMNHEINHNIGPNSWGRHTGTSGPRDTDYGCARAHGCGAPGPNSAWPDVGDDSIDALYEDDTLGWDPRYGLISWDRNDIMSYCQDRADPKRWISDYRWNKWVERLEAFEPGHPAPLSIHENLNNFLAGIQTSSIKLSQTETPTTRIVSGFVDSSGGGYLEPSYTVDGVWPNPSPDFRDDLSPSHYVRVEYPNQLIKEWPLYGTFSNAVDHENTTTSDLQSFQLALSDNDTIISIELVDQNGNVLDSYSSTSYGLQLELGVPDQITRGEEIQLILSGNFGNQSSNIYTQLQYSHDSKIWHNIGPQTLGESPQISVNKLPGGDQIQFRMRTTDGFQTEYVYGNQSTIVSDLSPKVRILQNQMSGGNDNQLKQSFTKGSVLSLSAKAYDPEDSLLSENQLSWKVIDIYGNVVEVQHGQTLNTQVLGNGTYKVMVEVTDSKGQTSSDYISVNVDNPNYLSRERLDELETIVNSSEEMSSESNFLFAPTITIMILPILLLEILTRPRKSRSAI